MKHLLSLADLSADDYCAAMDRSVYMKKRFAAGIADFPYAGKSLGMYFEKPSLRTRVSLEAAMNSLGGSAICLEGNGPDSFWKRECVKDQARVMSRFVSIVTMRTFSQAVIEEFAAEGSVPVINVLSDFEHPTQALADFLTYREHFGDIRGGTMVFLGDGNNVARSLLAAAAMEGVKFIWSGPEGYGLEKRFVRRVAEKTPGAVFAEERDPAKAVAKADIVYTDVWASMGQEAEAARREAAFRDYAVTDALLAKAPKTARVMHCLPAHRGSEISDSVMDGDRAIVYDQAENRMHAYRGIFSLLAGA